MVNMDNPHRDLLVADDPDFFFFFAADIVQPDTSQRKGIAIKTRPEGKGYIM